MIRDQIAANRFKSGVIIFFFILLVGCLAYVFGQTQKMGWFLTPVAVVVATLSAIGSYYYSDKIVLTISRARPVDRREYPHLYHSVEGLAIAAQIPTPRCYVIDDTAPNAFATGRNPENAVICVTTGLLQKLNRVELEGVIAHEMSHIKNYDILLMTIVTVLVGTVALLSDWMWRSMYWGGGRRRSSDGGGQIQMILMLLALILMILAPIIAVLIQAMVSRRREYLADANGALLTRYPDGLASALEKLAADTEPLEAANKATAHLYIVNPLHEHGGFLNSLFSTHPPIEDRVQRLRRM